MYYYGQTRITIDVLEYSGRVVYKIADVDNASMVSPYISDDKQGLAKYL
jgi:hypothetical protein